MHTVRFSGRLGGGRVSAWGIVCLGVVFTCGGCLPNGVEQPPVNRMTDVCENIIISGRILAFYLFRVYSEFQICLLKEKYRKKN